jgi:hypothetical protein
MRMDPLVHAPAFTLAPPSYFHSPRPRNCAPHAPHPTPPIPPTQGRDLERTVLAKAVRWHLSDRVIVHNNKTVVFE